MTNKYKDWRDLFEEVWKQNVLENTVAQMIFTGEITEFGSRDEKFEAAKQNLSNTIDESKKRLISLIEQIIEGERERILAALPVAMDKHHSYYERNRDFDLGLEKMVSEIRQIIRPETNSLEE